MLLKDVKPIPKQLYVKGNVKLFQEVGIAIIGSRCCTEVGFDIAKKFAKELASYGITIISGMAKGIDTAAHLGALEVGGNTIAVLGNGFKHIYPKENLELYNRIIQNNGMVVTEYPENEEPCSKNFIQRNRIVSGLSLGVIVIEAAYRSGTSITATLAIKQEKKVFCIPHNIDEMHGIGTNRLLQKGAYLITRPKDIFEHIKELKNRTKKIVKEEIKVVKEEYKPIYNLLKEEAQSIEQISKRIEMPVEKVNSILFFMELEELVERLPGNQYLIREE